MGEGTVGKTTLKHHFLTGSFTENIMATIGADFATHNIQVDDYDVTIVIWDIAGQESYSFMRETFYNHSEGALLLYDVTNKESFQKLESNWLVVVEEAIQHKIPIILCANKVDLRSNRVVSKKEGEKFTSNMKKKGWDITYLETSAKKGQNVNQSFETLTKKILARYQR
jgi:Ras-related protein Rab-1A